jgi:phosphoribosylformylglycinamidine cyclo-ligase
MGIGFVIALSEELAEEAIQLAIENGEKAYEIGRVVNVTGVHFKGTHDGSLGDE